MCGVDDLGRFVQPRAGSLGVQVKVLDAEWGRDRMVPLDTTAECVLACVEDKMPDRNPMSGKARADLTPVRLDQNSHRHHQSAADVVEYVSGGLDNEGTPRRPVLEVVRHGQPWSDVHEGLAHLLGIKHP